jgi:formylglycine-generating enzyme required for sulfatase activity
VFHVIRGGSYVDGAAWVRSAARNFPTAAYAANVGFRCAANAGS